MKTEILFVLMMAASAFVFLVVGIAILFAFFYSSPEVTVEEPVNEPAILPSFPSPNLQPSQIPSFPDNGDGCSKKWGWGNC